MFEGSKGSNKDNPGQDASGATAHRAGIRSLERLRDRIELTVKELARLRGENASLQKQLQEARAKEFEPIEGTPVVFSESPEALRSRVETFIDALDRYIDAAEHDTDPLHAPAESGG